MGAAFGMTPTFCAKEMKRGSSWLKPGVLELSIERVLRGDAEGDGVAGFTASFDGKGKFKILKKKRLPGYPRGKEAATRIPKPTPAR